MSLSFSRRQSELNERPEPTAFVDTNRPPSLFSPSALSKVTAGKTAISLEMALKLEAGLGIAARLWLAMQATYDLSSARKVVDLSHVVPVSVKDGLAVH